MQINIKTLKANIYKLITQIKTSSLNYRKKFGITICILWILIILVIPFNLYFESQNFILVGLAALLASATVIKNIENTNKIEKEKIKRELFKQRAEIIFVIKEIKDNLQKHIMFSTDDKIIDITRKIIYSEYIFEENEFNHIKPILELLLECNKKIILKNEFIGQNEYTIKLKKEITEIKTKIIKISEDIPDKLKDSIKLV